MRRVVPKRLVPLLQKSGSDYSIIKSVIVEDGYLVIIFVTEEGEQSVRIDLSEIFDADDYYTKTWVDANLVTNNALSNTLADYITQNALSVVLDSYATKQELASALADYVTLATDQHNITGSKSFTNRVNLASAYVTSYLSIPQIAPSVPLSGYTYLWSDANGNYSELPSGGGAANVYDLTIRRGSVSVGPYNLGDQAADIDLASLFSGYATQSWVNTQIGNIDFSPYALKTQIPTKVSDLTNDTGFITSSALNGYVNTIEQGDGNYVTGISKDGKKLVISRSTLPTKLSDFTDDVVSGNYLPIHGTADKALRLSGDAAHTAWGQTFWQNGVPKTISGDISNAGNITGSGQITIPKAKFSSSLIIPHVAPSGMLESGETYLYAGTGEYAEEPSGGGVADIYDLTIRKNGTLIGTYNLGEQDANVNIPVGWGDLTEDSRHRFLTDTLINTWNAKQPLDADLTAIAALTGSGLLRRNSGNTWSLDTNTYLTSSDHKALTLKVGTITIRSDFNSLAAKTYTITKANLTDTIGDTTYAPYNADGYVPTTRTVNGHPLSSDVTVTKGDVGLGNVENTALSTWAGSNNITTLGTITTGVWHGSKIANAYLANSSVTINSKSVSLGGSLTLTLDDIGNGTTRSLENYLPLSAGYDKPLTDTLYSQSLIPTQNMTYAIGDLNYRFGIGYFGMLSANIYANLSWTDISDALSIPTTAPDSTQTDFYDSSKVYLWADADGNYSEIPSGGGVADIYDLTLRRGSVSVGPYNLGEQAADIDLASLFSGYATESYVGNRISALNLGTASQKDFVTTIVSEGAGLPTAGTIYTFVNNAVTAAQPYKGVSSTAITDGGTEMPTISGYTIRTKGDVVAYNKKEFIWEGDKWRELGDEGSYALKTVQVIAGTGLAGGGAISQDVTLSLSSATQASLALADTALQLSDLDGYVNAISQTSGNYVTGITKSGKTLTITRATLPTTIALSNVTGADDLKAIEALTGTSGLLKKTAANTWALDTNSYLVSSSLKDLTLQVNGETAGTYNPNTAATINLPITEFTTSEEENAMFTSRQVPSVAVGDVCKITSVKGKSVVWNQKTRIWNSDKSLSENGVTITDNRDGSYTIQTVESGATARTVFQTQTASIIAGHKYYCVEYNKDGISLANSDYLSGSGIRTAIASYDTIAYPRIIVKAGTVATTPITLIPLIIDLTQMFGAGNEPATVEEFEALYPLPYYDYNTGELVNNAASGVEMLDSGGNSLGTIPLNITRLTSNGVQIFPDGMKSAGTAYDEWSGRTAVKRIGVVDLGTLSWTYYTLGSQNAFRTDFPGIVQPAKNSYAIANILCSKYVSDSSRVTKDKTISISEQSNTCRIYIQDNAYSDATTFKAAMSGVYLYYELAKPETYTVDALPDTLVPFDATGTQRRLPVDTSEEVAAPMVCDFQYGANIGDLLPTVDYKIRHGHVALADEAIKLQTARTLWGQSFDGTANVSGALTEVTDITGTGLITMPNGKFTSSCIIPHIAPTGTLETGEVYFWSDTTGIYSEMPSGSGGDVGDIYPLTVVVNGAQTVYNPAEQRQTLTLSIPTALSSLTDDATHRLVTDTQISTWNAKQAAISDLATIRSNANLGAAAYGWGDHRQAGYLTSYTETDPVFSASAAAGITSGNISAWNGKQDAISDLSTIRSNASTAATAVDVQQGSGLGIDSNGHLTLDSHDAADVLELGSAAFKGYDTAVISGSANLVTSGAVYTAVSAKYTKPSTGIPKTDLASAVQTSLGKADTALQSVAFSDLTSHPTTLSGYGITDAKIANGTITLGSNSITPLTSFTETDPTVSAWAKAASKPTYTLDEITDGNTRKLSNYLPLTGGTLTGNLTTMNILAGAASATVGTLAAPFNSFYSGNYNGVGQFGAVMVVDNTSYSVINATTSFLLIGRGYNASSGLAKPTTICGNYISFEVGSLGGVVTINSNGYITPNANGAYDFGGASRRWSIVYANTLNAATGITTAGTLSVTGESTFTGNLLPKTTNATDIGSSSKKFKDIYSIGTIYADGSLSIPTAAPSNPVSTKTYLWCDTTGNYAESPQS